MLKGRRILLVEDDEIMGASIAQRLDLEGAKVQWVKQVVRAIPAVRTPRAPVDAVICDIRLPDGTGEEIFTELSRTMRPPPFLFITGQGGIEQAVRLMHAGAADYVTKPFDIGVFLERLELLMRPRETVRMPPILGTSPAARRVDALAAAAAAADDAVLILGASGTGKALVARQIHRASERRAAPLVEVNLAREPDPGAMLFGRDGALARTGEGVLLLHALERLSASDQTTLFLELDRGFEGRLIATCTAEIEHAVADGRFRADLHARLAASEIPIPPLGERTEDAVWLANEIFASLNAGRERPMRGISSLGEEALRAHDWPGNGREVRSRLTRAVALGDHEWLFPADLFPERQIAGIFQTLSEVRDTAERGHIVAALERTGGQVTEAARLLKVSRTTLWEKMQKLGI